MSDLTPARIEERLSALVTAITRAQMQLRDARDAETEAEIALRKAEIQAAFDPSCPKVRRGEATVGDRDRWIDRAVLPAWEAHRRAVTAREKAIDFTKAVAAELECVRSQGTLVRQAYSLAGTS
jgi:hypothetical protein